MEETPVLLDISDGIATVTLNRPQARNALSSGLLAELRRTMAAVEHDDAVRVIILTGSDPAFTAGLDLKELGSTGDNIRGSASGEASDETAPSTPWLALTKPLIGAVNGVAVTGGFEIALHCDLLIASENARFADTHARVGILPGWGLSVLLPQAVGLRRAKELSLTGNFLDAQTAYDWGLVNHVVPHAELLPTARAIAAAMVTIDADTSNAYLASYKASSAAPTLPEALRLEAGASRASHERGFDPAEVEKRRVAIMERGRTQL